MIFDEERRADLRDKWAREAERDRYRECEHPGCSAEAEWRNEESDVWLCGEHTK